jgi:crotonobetainyl-CoA:carnitine CoA-transferase CaiB-like acyl-CoA transferase
VAAGPGTRARPDGCTGKVFDELIANADVYIQNFRPGTAERLGAGRQRLQDLNPKLVYCSISGFGADGPYADRPSYDSVAQALSGFLSVVVDPDRPRFLGPALADAITGIYAAYGVLGALFERSRTGSGRLVEVSMLEAMAHFAVEPFAAFFALDRAPQSSDRPRLALRNSAAPPRSDRKQASKGRIHCSVRSPIDFAP